MSEEKICEKASFNNITQDVKAGDPTVVDEGTCDPHMHWSLKGRHVSMIECYCELSTLVDRSVFDILLRIGTSLFVSLGKAVANRGPVGAILGYFIVGMLLRFMMYSLGEVSFFFS